MAHANSAVDLVKDRHPLLCREGRIQQKLPKILAAGECGGKIFQLLLNLCSVQLRVQHYIGQGAGIRAAKQPSAFPSALRVLAEALRELVQQAAIIVLCQYQSLGRAIHG